MDDDESKVAVYGLAVDPDYLETMGMELVAGRNFSKEIASDADQSIIVNETAARLYGLEDKVDQQLDLELGRPAPILIGIVSDFHTGSLHKPIQPAVLSMTPALYNAFVLRVRERRFSAVLASLKEMWQRFAPDQPFEVRFADDVLQAQYEAERRLARTFRFFAGLAIFISCLGLFGLAAIAAERRTKEIGIRKVMGATISGLLTLLTKDFVRLVLIAFVIAVPIAYLAMNRWLQDFAYRVEIGPGPFLVAGALVLIVALLASSYHAVRAALADPVDSLRYE
jgi:putative ABC transport system permease protein